MIETAKFNKLNPMAYLTYLLTELPKIGDEPTDENLLKILYLVTGKVSKRWTRKYSNWNLVTNQLKILFSEILEKTV